VATSGTAPDAGVTERVWSGSIPHHALAASVARARMSSELSAEVGPDLLADAVAVIAELVGNAIRHAQPLPGDVIRVTWRVRHLSDLHHVTITVTDGGSDRRPIVRRPDPEALDGRGLAIVEALSDEWGVEHDGLGQTVWAEIRHATRVPATVAA
jgi:anti-sigma regulatory factor (Ser/Thr protein kinase)